MGFRELIGLDRPGEGTKHREVIGAVIRVCQECGIFQHYEKYKDDWVEDITETGDIEIGHHYTRYGFSVRSSRRSAFLSKAPEFCAALNLPEGSVTIEIEGGTYFVCVAHQTDEVLMVEDVIQGMPMLDPCQVLAGVDVHGDGILIPFADPTSPHGAIVSMTGGGKTAAMRLMIATALMSGTRVALFDPVGDSEKGFFPLSGHPLVFKHGMFHGISNCERGLGMIAQRIGSRTRTAPMLIFVDEAGDLCIQSPTCKALLRRIAQAGRNEGLHLVIGNQSLSTDDLGKDLVRNMAVRIVGKVADPVAAWQATGRRGSGAELLRGNGDFLYVGKREIRIQVPWASTEWLRTVSPHEPRMADLPPLPEPRKVVRVVESGNGGAGGRTPDDIPNWVLSEIKGFQNDEGKDPSLNWVYRLTKERIGQGFNRDKSQRAIDMANNAVGVM